MQEREKLAEQSVVNGKQRKLTRTSSTDSIGHHVEPSPSNNQRNPLVEGMVSLGSELNGESGGNKRDMTCFVFE